MIRRKPEYLSPSALGTYEHSPEEYYVRYLSPNKTPRFPQTQPMSVGSAFDAYIKSHCFLKLFGPNHKNSSKFDLKNLFEAQVEAHNRDWAWPNGEYVFNSYLKSGALADLMLELESASEEPNFEFDIRGEVQGYREGVTKKMAGMILMGKPDIRFVNSSGAHCIFDWKVNGYCAKGNTSPKPGYIQCRELGDLGFWLRSGPHKDCQIEEALGMKINRAAYLEAIDESWATQNAAYGWLLGEPVGAEIIAGIDQIVGNGSCRNSDGRPALRIASHRTRVSEQFQFHALSRFQNLWSLIFAEPFHFFKDLSLADSEARCHMLDHRAKVLAAPPTGSDAEWAMNISREEKKW